MLYSGDCPCNFFYCRPTWDLCKQILYEKLITSISSKTKFANKLVPYFNDSIIETTFR